MPLFRYLCWVMIGFGIIACNKAGDRQVKSSDAPPASDRQREKFEPEDGKVLLFVGQELEAVGGLDAFSDGYLDHFERPAGWTAYTFLNPGGESFGFKHTGLNGVWTTDDWGDGPSNMSLQIADPDFDNMALAIGLGMVDNEKAVANDERDDLIKKLGDFLKGLAPRPVFLRVGYEFDGHSWNHYDIDAFKAAFRRIRDRFEEMDIDNVAYVWQSTGWVSNPDMLEEWYPGDEYVDWCGFSFFSRWEEQQMIEFARKHHKPVFIAEATPTISDHTVKFDGKTKATILSNPEQAEEAWNKWFVPFFRTINKNPDVVKAVSYINCHWKANRMWLDNPTFQEVDARLQTSEMISEKWKAEISGERYLHAHPGLFEELGEVSPSDQYPQISGIYPHLAYYNREGECGTGAVVPWAGRLWVITYSPHQPLGSSDKLYEISPDLKQITREESIGGTPANRMIHRESDQLFIGPYAIDADRNVRVIPYPEMPGRHTGNARHLTDPADKIYYGTMEEGFYEVNVNTLEISMLYKDGNDNEQVKDHDPTDVNPENATLPGAHGKGLYSGQGVLVYSNNGEATPEALKQFDIESGALAEWDGKDWKLVRRNQFVEVTGPGGIYGNDNPETDPIWTTGWDHRSLLLGVRSPAGWNFFRLPKASHSYDGAHGWNTEWPRIRNVGTQENPDYLMTMHGMFWRFPGGFSVGKTAGIRPRSAYLKVIGDFTRWNDQLVFGCDDSAQREFLNKRKHKGGIEGPGQSNSNLWFTSPEKPDQLGPNTATGAVWLNETVEAGVYSEPFLFAGWPNRSAWIRHNAPGAVEFTFEVDKAGNGQWEVLRSINVLPEKPAFIEFPLGEQGEWIRLKPGRAASDLTVSFTYSDTEQRTTTVDDIFTGLVSASQPEALGGLLYGLGNDRRALGMAVQRFGNGTKTWAGYYELDEKMNLTPKDDPETLSFIQEKFAIPENVVSVEAASVLVVDDQGRRWRFPLGAEAFTELTNAAGLRICREVATERDLFNCHGTFYELPAENADGFAKVRPIASHNFRIHDYASYRGLLIMTGLVPNTEKGEHIIRSEDGKAALWAGTIDDLWKLGKPTGRGGPWKETMVTPGNPSDPYLIGCYDKRSLTLSHDGETPVTFRMEVEPLGHGPWLLYREVTVKAGESFTHVFPHHFQARWIRFSADKSCRATAWLEYR